MTTDLHRVLVPVDRSPDATAALDVAVRLARVAKATLTLLAVAPMAVVPTAEPAIGVPVPDPEPQDELDRLAREQVDEVAAALPKGIDVRAKLGWGPAGEAIAVEAKEGGHDLVVMPWHQAGPIGHLMHHDDHAARHVLDHCPVPVVAVPV